MSANGAVPTNPESLLVLGQRRPAGPKGRRGGRPTRTFSSASPLAAATVLATLLVAGATWVLAAGSSSGSRPDPVLAAGPGGFGIDLRSNRIIGPSLDGLGDPGPGFASARAGALPQALSTRPRGLAVSTFGDARVPALAISDFSGNQVIVYGLRPDGTSSLTPSRILRVPAGPRGLLATDLDADGRVDLAVASAVSQEVTIFLGRGDFDFELTESLPIDGIPIAFERDGESMGSSLRGETRTSGSASPAPRALLVDLADGRILRFRSLGGGFFDHQPETLVTTDGAAGEPPDGRTVPSLRTRLAVDESDVAGGVASSLSSLRGTDRTGSAPSGTVPRPGETTRVAASFTTPQVDFDVLKGCVAGLAIPSTTIKAATTKASKAQSIYIGAAAGTSAKKFAKSVAQLNGYIGIINGQVGVTIDQQAADACVVPAQTDVDAILLIGQPASVDTVSGDGQTGRPFSPLPTPLTVIVHDVYDNPIPKLAVAFSATAGTAGLSPANSKTDLTGTATTKVTLGGPPDGDVTIAASAGTAPGATFTARKVTGVISLAADVQPIFSNNCALSGCHAGSMPQQNQNLSAGNLFNPTTGIVNVVSMEAAPRVRVKPGASGLSYLVNKIEGTQGSVGGSGAQMPFGRTPLGSLQRFLIETWIDQGAANN